MGDATEEKRLKREPSDGTRVLTRMLRIYTLRNKSFAANTLRRAVFRDAIYSNGRGREAGLITSQIG